MSTPEIVNSIEIPEGQPNPFNSSAVRRWVDALADWREDWFEWLVAQDGVRRKATRAGVAHRYAVVLDCIHPRYDPKHPGRGGPGVIFIGQDRHVETYFGHGVILPRAEEGEADE